MKAWIVMGVGGLMHHYHPDYPAGNRCRPDDGKP